MVELLLWNSDGPERRSFKAAAYGISKGFLIAQKTLEAEWVCLAEWVAPDGWVCVDDAGKIYDSMMVQKFEDA